MTSNDNEDPITPGPEDRTMPSGKAQRKVPGKAKPATDGDGIDRTMPSGSVTPPVETGGLDLTMPSGGAKPPVDEGGFDLTAPSGKAHLDGAEDATMPSGSAGADKSEDATMASGNAGGASEDATMASGNAGGASEDPTMASGSAKASGQVYNAGELMGKTIGGCRIDKLLGRGAMGAVYKARQLKLDRDVAVKVIRPEMMTDPRMLKRFQIEARTVGKFNSANVVMVHDVGFELGVHYLVMEFVEGKNLREHVKLLAGGRLPAGEALSLIRQSCKGLEEARRLKVVHRDIKPDNLMLTTQNVLKIADFGIAKPEEDFSMTLTSELIGTPLYMSPEQCHGGGSIDFRSDMYSLGATFFYLLTGEPPIRASSVYELIQTKTKLENLCLWKSLPELDENHPLSRVIERMTANSREDRYESYEELLNDLLLVEAGETITVRAKRIKKDTAEKEARFAEPEKSGLPMMAILLVLLVLVGGGGGYYWWSTGSVIPGVDSVEKARVMLNGFRKRLGETGPSKALRDELMAMSLPVVMHPERDSVQSDIDDGLKIDARLGLLKAPTKPQMPFDDVTEHFAAVTVAAAGADVVGKEVRAWLLGRIDAARAEAAAGDAAILVLGREFQDWREDLRKAKEQGLDGSVPGLSKELGRIDAARLKLFDVLPSHRSALEAQVSSANIRDARTGLLPAEVGDDGAKVRAALSTIQDDFLENGFKESLLNSAKKLNSTDAEVKVEVTTLIDQMDRANKAVQVVKNVDRPARAKAPGFDGVDAFLEAIDNALDEARIDGVLPKWAQAMSDKERAEDRWSREMVAACASLWKQWKEDQGNEDISLADLQRDMAKIETAVRRATEVLPECEDGLEQRVPAARRKSALASLVVKRKVGKWQKELTAAKGELSRVTNLGDWGSKKRVLIAAHESLSTQLAKFDAGQRVELEGDLKRFQDDYTKWGTAFDALDDAAKQFARGELEACTHAANLGMAYEEGKEEFVALNDVIVACKAAFVEFEQNLAMEKARRLLDSASVRATAKSLPADIGKLISAWKTGISKLENATRSGMILIRANGSQKAFFVASTECRNSKFKEFQVAVESAEKSGGLDAVKKELKGMAIAKGDVDDLLEVRTKDGDKPVERVTWIGAVAYCRWRGLDLPTKKEWLFAAFGEPRQKYSWGDAWSDSDEAKRNPNSDSVNVDAGGGSWRNVDLHHMSGNVAEWLADEKAETVEAIGGRYSVQNRGRAQEQASGQSVERLSTTAAMKGIGFRAVLRPRNYLKITWPR